MAKKQKTIPGKATRSTRYMRRHPEEAKHFTPNARRDRLQAVFQDMVLTRK